jgi:N-acyl-D-amino-acid deacylase
MIIRNARMYDGTGSAPYTGDVAVDDDRISAVGGSLPPAAGCEEVHGTGLAVMPGSWICTPTRTYR